MPSIVAPLRRALPLIAVLCFGIGCLSPAEALEKTDAEAAEILAEKQIAAFGAARPFEVNPPARRIRDDVLDPATGLASRPAALPVDLKAAFELAAGNARDFQDRKETLWRSALALISGRERFRPSPFFNLSGGTTRDGDDTSVDVGGEFGVTKVLESGGTALLSVGSNFLRFITSPTSESASSFINLAITLPLLRDAGQAVALEGLRQEERNVVYAVRSFERFKQTFAAGVEIEYLRLLAAQRQVANEERNLENVSEARRRNEALAQAQRLTQIEVDQARQDELRAQNRLISRRDAFSTQLDDFKNTLGLPVDMPVSVNGDDLGALEALLERPFEIEETRALTRGLALRLDLANVREQIADANRRIKVAEDALLPDLTLGLSARPAGEPNKPLKIDFGEGRYSANFDANLGLDRDLERVELRRAHLDLSSAVRSEEDLSDSVKRDIRTALRRLHQARDTYDIQKLSVAVAERRRESVIEFRNRGDASTRDLLEAQEALVNAENALAEALVEYRASYLLFYRDTGALVVRPEGLDHETSDALLLVP